MRLFNRNEQEEGSLHKSQIKFRHTRPEWRLFEKILRDLKMSDADIMKAEHAILQVGFTSGKKFSRQFMGIDRYDTGMSGDPSLPMPGGNGRFMLPKSPFRLMRRMAARAEKAHLLKTGWVRHLGVYFKK